MNWNEILAIILGSSVLSVLLDRFIQLLQEDQHRSKDEERNLYSELALLVDLALTARKTIKEVNQDIIAYSKTFTTGDRNTIQENINNQMIESTKLLVPYWWSLVDKIKNLLENKAGFIRVKDRETVAMFFEAYLKRLLIGKDKADKLYWITEEKYNEYQDSIFDAIYKLSKISNKIIQSMEKEQFDKIPDSDKLTIIKTYMDLVYDAVSKRMAMLPAISALAATLLVVATFNNNLIILDDFIRSLISILLLMIPVSLIVYNYDLKKAQIGNIKTLEKILGDLSIQSVSKIDKLTTWLPDGLIYLLTFVIVSIIVVIWK